MLLINYVRALRKYCSQLTDQDCIVPMYGEADSTAFNFIVGNIQAREISGLIREVNKTNCLLPKHLHTRHIHGRDEQSKKTQRELTSFLNMIVHMKYLRYVDILDVINDRGERIIVDRDHYISHIKCLSSLSLNDIMLLSCALAEVSLTVPNDDVRTWTSKADNLTYCVMSIHRWPKICELFWEKFFAPRRAPVSSDDNTVEYPCVNPQWQRAWKIHWRRGAVKSAVSVELADLISFFRSNQ